MPGVIYKNLKTKNSPPYKRKNTGNPTPPLQPARLERERDSSIDPCNGGAWKRQRRSDTHLCRVRQALARRQQAQSCRLHAQALTLTALAGAAAVEFYDRQYGGKS
ncbi:hypothetical protein Taro_051110 [Colocasia esculenta]|uniref:Uncharacterized protein n=1 Tax=Colocasia esculenta TaxID=4460 RepID=A0A843XF46_COLES|nr:hypothetical protein [Colocasia esculenta]